MRKLALTLLPLLLLACDREPMAPKATPVPSFAATSDWTTEVLDLPAGDFTFYAPCIDDWFDEVGPITNSFHTVTTNNGSLLYIKVGFLEGFHLVGDRTGMWNPAVPNQQGTYVERIPGGPGSYTFHYYLTPYFYVNEVSGTKMNWTLMLKVTINANGQVTVDRDMEPCNIVGK